MQKQLNLSDLDEDFRIDDNFPTMQEDDEKETCPKCFNELPQVEKCRKCKGTGFVGIIIIALMFCSCNPNYRWVLGNPRVKHQNEIKQQAKERKVSPTINQNQAAVK